MLLSVELITEQSPQDFSSKGLESDRLFKYEETKRLHMLLPYVAVYFKQDSGMK